MLCTTGVSSLGVPGVPWHPQILADQLTLSQPGGADYAHHIMYYWHPRIFRPSYGPVLRFLNFKFCSHLIFATKLFAQVRCAVCF